MRNTLQDRLDSHLLVAFQDSTLVLKITHGKLSQATNTSFVTNETTLHCNLVTASIQIQVTNQSLVQLKGLGESRRQTKWMSNKGRILMACSNAQQVILYTESAQIVSFEFD